MTDAPKIGGRFVSRANTSSPIKLNEVTHDLTAIASYLAYLDIKAKIDAIHSELVRAQKSKENWEIAEEELYSKLDILRWHNSIVGSTEQSEKLLNRLHTFVIEKELGEKRQREKNNVSQGELKKWLEEGEIALARLLINDGGLSGIFDTNKSIIDARRARREQDEQGRKQDEQGQKLDEQGRKQDEQGR